MPLGSSLRVNIDGSMPWIVYNVGILHRCVGIDLGFYIVYVQVYRLVLGI
jgi:hypothetical protein